MDKIITKKFFIRLFLFSIFVIVVQKIFGVSYITDTMTLGAMGFITTLIGLNVYDKKSNS